MTAEKLRKTGWLILGLGLGVAAIIYLSQPQDPGSDADNDITANKRDTYQLEKIGGRALVSGIEFNLWFASLWHGKRLAYTVAVLAGAGSALCWWMAQQRSG